MLPAIQEMRDVGYLASAKEMQDVWAWARVHNPEDGVCPTPIDGEQEAMTFVSGAEETEPAHGRHCRHLRLTRPSPPRLRAQLTCIFPPLTCCVSPPHLVLSHVPRQGACGWPSSQSTAEEWLAMLQYWTCLREQLCYGAPRRARGKATGFF